MHVTDIIGVKGSEVYALPPSATVAELTQLLQDKRIGAVVVTDDGEMRGIVSERDIVRFLNKSADLTAPLSTIMSTDIWTCRPEDALSEVAKVMTVERIRHLPVLNEGRVVAIVSIGDVVKARLDDLEAERDHLERYVKS